MATDKYDRQLRLWGHHGQRLLREATILLLGSAAPGVEALKNLILPGAGSVVIWDDATTKVEDLGCNFYLTEHSIGKPRAQQTLETLLEINPDVKGRAVVASTKDFVASQDLKQFALIISNQQSEAVNVELSEKCYQSNTAVIFVNTYGFYGYVRNQKRLHEVYENKELKKVDMRLAEPFPALLAYTKEQAVVELLADPTPDNIDKLVHTPYAALIIAAIQAVGSTKSKDVKDKLKEWKVSVNSDDLENFDQAAGNVHRLSQTKKSVIENMQNVLEHKEVDAATAASPAYWVMCKTLKAYINKHGDYPQLKEIPDMKASTKAYIALKQVYMDEHNRTKQLFLQLLGELFPGYEPNLDLVTLFIENLTNLEVVEMRSFAQELTKPQEFTFQTNYPMIYVALRGAALFRAQHNRFASSKDLPELQKCVRQVKQQYYPDMLDIENNVVREVARVQGAQIVSISSIVGSIVAQEGIKLITHQFTPFNSGYFFDGVQSVGTNTQL